MTSGIGISGKTQLLFLVTYMTRYLDTYGVDIIKMSLIFMSLITVLLIYTVFDETHEVQHDTYWISPSIVICLGLGFQFNYALTYVEVLWAFSRYLEVVTIIPQLYFIYRKRYKPSVIRSYIILLLLYRGFYILNWIYRYTIEDHFDPIIVIPGVLQFLVYFAYFFLPYATLSNQLPTLSQQIANNLPSVLTFNVDGKNGKDLKPLEADNLTPKSTVQIDVTCIK
uniref:Uncharacterized protein n=1 Tax=Rhodnius prolixus TaxID=13249 RepID=T1HL98_RHOPR